MKEKLKKSKGITLIALVITIVLILVIAVIAINVATGNNGLISKANESEFKSKISKIQEELQLYKVEMQIKKQVGEESASQFEEKNIYAGYLLERIATAEDLEIDTSEIKDLKQAIPSVNSDEENYLMVYEGDLYYVSQENIENNTNQEKWSKEMGLKIWKLSSDGIGIVEGKYEKVNGIYLSVPITEKVFNKNTTRYLEPNQDMTKMIAGDYITKSPKDTWYDYSDNKWANLYVENDGYAIYYVWIPRYAYKLDSSNQKTDVVFIDTDNTYIDSITDEQHNFEDLGEEYKIPDAFTFNNKELSGFWAMKYVIQDTTSEVIINYDINVKKLKATITNIRTNTSDTIAKYQMAVNGNIKLEKTVLEITNDSDIELDGLKAGDNYISVTALDGDGQIIGSMTKQYTIDEPNSPQLKNKNGEWIFNPETTYYVIYNNDVEDSSTLISESAPTDWYDYGSGKWANIVTRNNEGTIYYTWIPRYQYILSESDKAAQKTTVRFIKGTSTKTISGYKIPDAFTFKGEEITGYWAMKYVIGN